MMKWNDIFKGIFGKPQPAPDKPAAPGPAREEPQRKIVIPPDYRDPLYLSLAAQCAMGDILAMMDLARWHRSWCLPGAEQALAAYEADPEKLGELEAWLRSNRYNPANSPTLYYITWVCRAALYGNSEAEELMARCGSYRYYTLLPASLFQVDAFPIDLISSLYMNHLGFTDIDSDLDGFAVRSLRHEGIFPCCYVADYIPADSDGFGREDTYESIYFDEFFNRLPGKTFGEAQASLTAVKQKRERYWADPAHDREHRMYKRLLADG